MKKMYNLYAVYNLYAYGKGFKIMKEGAIFDLDGTLVNSMKVWENADYILAERYGFKPDEEYWNKGYVMFFYAGRGIYYRKI